MSEKPTSTQSEYQIYLDMMKEHLIAIKKRPLYHDEEEVVIAHLKAAALLFCHQHGKVRDDVDIYTAYTGLDLPAVLAIEAARIVSKIHPDLLDFTEQQLEQRTEEVLAVQNFLKTDMGAKSTEEFNEKLKASFSMMQ